MRLPWAQCPLILSNYPNKPFCNDFGESYTFCDLTTCKGAWRARHSWCFTTKVLKHLLWPFKIWQYAYKCCSYLRVCKQFLPISFPCRISFPSTLTPIVMWTCSGIMVEIIRAGQCQKASATCRCTVLLYQIDDHWRKDTDALAGTPLRLQTKYVWGRVYYNRGIGSLCGILNIPTKTSRAWTKPPDHTWLAVLLKCIG